MRIAFWIAMVAGLALAIAYFFFPMPLTSVVDRQTLAERYETLMIWAAILGVAAGVLAGWLATRRIHHSPHEHARDFLGRVGLWGFSSEIFAVGLVFVASSILIASGALGPLAPAEKLGLIIPSGKFLSVLGVGMVADALLFLVITSTVSWGGKYALTRQITH
ncbi:hypothetical protein [Rhodocaloribacter sp.]